MLLFKVAKNLSRRQSIIPSLSFFFNCIFIMNINSIVNLKFFKNIVFCLFIVLTTSSIYYLTATRKLPTPYADSMTKIQLRLKAQSQSLRKPKYYEGLILGIFLVWMYWNKLMS